MNLDDARQPPYLHQRVGVEALTRLNDPTTGRMLPGCFALFDEMGAGKTKQVIDAAQVLFRDGQIDKLLIVAPPAVRTGVWFDPELGELRKHLWETIPARVTEYHIKNRTWFWHLDDPSQGWLEVLITNYEFLRKPERLAPLLHLVDAKTWLVCDESSALNSHRAEQTKAVLALRRRCGRVTILNGSPVSHSPLDLYGQAAVLAPTERGFGSRIFDCANFFEFRARYAIIITEPGFLKITGWRNLEDVQRRMAPYVLRRLKRECLDLPPVLDPVTLVVRLTPATWRVYKGLRDEFIAWLDSQTVAVAAQAGVKALRLAQVCSGFVGGLEGGPAPTVPDRPSWLPFHPEPLPSAPSGGPAGPTRAVGREKLEAVLEWLGERWAEDPSLKLLIWCRFRPELERLLKETRERFPDVAVGAIWGKQARDEREAALRLLDPRTAPAGGVVVYGIPRAGALGLNLTAAHYMLFASNGTFLRDRLQALARVDRPGQTEAVWQGDLVAEGPNGQKTIDHVILKALRDREDLATWTCSAWSRALRAE